MRTDAFDTILTYLPGHIRAPLERASPLFRNDAHEIILRSELPLTVECADRRCYLTEQGSITANGSEPRLLTVSTSDMLSVFKSICDYSVFARQNELNQGYITVKNGVRVGVCGTAVTKDGVLVNIRDLTTICFRVSCEIIGCADALLDRVDPLGGVLICGPPCSGKTTIIRDLARSLSQRCKVSVIDERNEISATFGCRKGFDVGMSDVMVGIRKVEGVIRVLRSLSPDIIICDELGDRRDAEMLRCVLRCGTAFVATVHARNPDDLFRRDITAEILDTGAFRYLVFLGTRHSAGKIKEIRERRDGCYETVPVYAARRGFCGDRIVSASASA